MTYVPAIPKPAHRKRQRPGRLEGDDLEALRIACFLRDKGLCTRCAKAVHFNKRFDGDPDAYDMAHKRNRRMYGDNIHNVEVMCHDCHMKSHNAGGKPCPKKPKSDGVAA